MKTPKYSASSKEGPSFANNNNNPPLATNESITYFSEDL